MVLIAARSLLSLLFLLSGPPALAGPLVAAPAPKPSLDDWAATLDRVTPAVVSVRNRATRAFDTERAGTSVATAFVVDAERGILLTNRHVVTPGPVVSEAVFLNNEEVPLIPIYRDPIHDFGFFKFDPRAVKHMSLVALPLLPEHAKVGVDLRVVGNDAGEKISILSGTLARIDREAPAYGGDKYNDFNTFYMQAASSTSGGSSGSPVLDIHGHVIALNAGARGEAASSFYLPLDRVVRALARIQAGLPVTRGTIQAVFTHPSFAEAKRLGLPPETEAAIRAERPNETGVLIVDRVIPKGTASDLLKPGDVVTRLNGAVVTTYVPLEAAMDDNVGSTVQLEVERGGKPLKLTISVQDLHAITPSSYLEYGGAILNSLSFQQARNHNEPTGVVYVATNGYALQRAGVADGAVIVAIAGAPTPDLGAAEAVLSALPDGERVQVRFRGLEDKQERVGVLTNERGWFPMRHCERDDVTGRWPCVDLPAPPLAGARGPETVALPTAKSRVAERVARSLVTVEAALPYRTEGVGGESFTGLGLVVDAKQGLVLCDRNTVPVALADVWVSVAGALRVPASVVFIDPNHDLAVVRYDPASIGTTPLTTAVFNTKPVTRREALTQVGLDNRQQVVWGETKVTGNYPMQLSQPRTPGFREYNLDVVVIEGAPLNRGGVLVDKAGHIRAYQASFLDGADKPRENFWGIESAVLDAIVGPLRRGETPDTRTLGVAWETLSVASARDRGLPASEAAALVEHNPGRAQVLAVHRLAAGTEAARMLRPGDILVAVGGRPVVRFAEVEAAAHADIVALRVWRDGLPVDVSVHPVRLPAQGLARAVVWAGALLHEPQFPVSIQRGVPLEGVYVAFGWYGSPADQHRLTGTKRIMAVDDTPTLDLDAFVAAVRGRAGTVRLTLRDLAGRTEVITLKQDADYWPTFELVHGAAGWLRTPL